MRIRVEKDGMRRTAPKSGSIVIVIRCQVTVTVTPAPLLFLRPGVDGAGSTPPDYYYCARRIPGRRDNSGTRGGKNKRPNPRLRSAPRPTWGECARLR